MIKIMGIRVKSTDIRQEFERATSRVDKVMFKALSYAGEKAINAARANHPNNWTDQTGNLRSSVGYVVVHDGKIVSTKGFAGTADGAFEGKAQAARIASTYPTGWVLIVVAGMHYASYVAGKGYDVLDTAQHEAVKAIEKINPFE